jgi:hypothetical protein
MQRSAQKKFYAAPTALDFNLHLTHASGFALLAFSMG